MKMEGWALLGLGGIIVLFFVMKRPAGGNVVNPQAFNWSNAGGSGGGFMIPSFTSIANALPAWKNGAYGSPARYANLPTNADLSQPFYYP